MDGPQPEELIFQASDGWRLAADIYRGPDPNAAILISAGTGFPRQFYRDVARYYAAKGAVVMTYDYRGIAGSAAADLATSDIDLPDWGRLDLAAAISALADAAPDLPIGHVAHSVGGHIVGLAANHSRVRRHAFVSVGTGFWGAHHRRDVPKELYFWWILGNYSLARHGYIAQIGGWNGEPLPPKLFKTWRRWSHRRSYFRSELNSYLVPNHYSEIEAPIRSWIFPDDPIATPRAARELLKSYPNAPTEIVMRKPADVGVKRIGHEGALRKGRERLWDEFWDWLNEAG